MKKKEEEIDETGTVVKLKKRTPEQMIKYLQEQIDEQKVVIKEARPKAEKRLEVLEALLAEAEKRVEKKTQLAKAKKEYEDVVAKIKAGEEVINTET